MDELTRDQLRNLVQALQALSQAVDKSIDFDFHKGIGGMMAKQYTGLHLRAVRILADDPYLVEFLGADSLRDVNNEQKVMQVKILSDQLMLYLQGLIRADNRKSSAETAQNTDRSEQELSQRFMDVTKETLRRAMNRDLDNPRETPSSSRRRDEE